MIQKTTLFSEAFMGGLFFIKQKVDVLYLAVFPVAHSVPHVDGWRIISGVVYVILYGLQWKGAPKEYG